MMIFVLLFCPQKRQAELYDCILKQMRPEPEYFRVGYFGLGFPSFLQVRAMDVITLDCCCLKENFT